MGVSDRLIVVSHDEVAGGAADVNAAQRPFLPGKPHDCTDPFVNCFESLVARVFGTETKNDQRTFRGGSTRR